MRQRTDPRTHLKRLVDNWSQISEDLLLLPDALHKIARRALEGQEENARESIQESPSVREAVNVRGGIFTGAVLLLAGVLWIGLEAAPPWPGWLCAATGLVLTIRTGR